MRRDWVIGVIITTAVIIFFAYLSTLKVPTRDQQLQAKATPTVQKTNEEVGTLLESSEQKTEEAQDLLSKKDATEEDRAKAKQLILESVAEAKKAVDAQPKNPAAWYHLGQLYHELGGINPKNDALAEDAFSHAVVLDSSNSDYYKQLAMTRIYMKKYTDAESDLKKAIALNPRDPSYYFSLANVHVELKDYDSAREEYEIAKKLTPPTSERQLMMIDAQVKKLDKLEVNMIPH